MEKLTAVVPTFNEESKIEGCLRSLRWADELIVVDSFSSDGTVRVAEKIADRVELHRFENFARQKNFCIRSAGNRWVLLLDADERVTPGLREEIENVLRRPDKAGYWIPRVNHFLGKRISHGGWGGERVLRLFDKTLAHYPDREVHERLCLKGEAGVLRGPIVHYPYESIEEYFRKCRTYVALSAKQLNSDGRRAGPAELLLRAPAKFLRMYLLQAGFLDGTHGLVLAGLSAFQVFAKYAALWELQRRGGQA